jgi:hypothetical protein
VGAWRSSGWARIPPGSRPSSRYSSSGTWTPAAASTSRSTTAPVTPVKRAERRWRNGRRGCTSSGSRGTVPNSIRRNGSGAGSNRTAVAISRGRSVASSTRSWPAYGASGAPAWRSSTRSRSGFSTATGGRPPAAHPAARRARRTRLRGEHGPRTYRHLLSPDYAISAGGARRGGTKGSRWDGRRPSAAGRYAAARARGRRATSVHQPWRLSALAVLRRVAALAERWEHATGMRR